MIRFQDVTMIYKDTGVTALDNVSFHVAKGEFVFLIGPTGAGKTTLTKLILREALPSDGRIVVNGTDLAGLKRRHVPLHRRQVGMVFQDFRLLPDRTAYENVAFAMEVVGTPPRTVRHIVPQVLTLVGLQDKADARPDQLSGGEQQRVSLARAIANNPPILIADEPTGNLDPDTSWEIIRLLVEINKRGATVIVATHARELVDRLQKRVIALENGILVRDEKQGVYAHG